MTRVLIIIAFISFLGACDKGNANTTPSLKIKSANFDVVPAGQTLVVSFDFTDKEGDVDSLFMIRQRLNRRGELTTPKGSYRFPNAPDLKKGEAQFTMEYANTLTAGINEIIVTNNPRVVEPDTLRIRFTIKDKAGNSSDTADLNVIVRRQ